MAERIVSPGVFTNEVDQSYLAGGIAQIGAAIVGPTLKGPALIPTQISSYGEFVSKFGSYTDDSYIPFVVQDYLRSGNVITVTRLLYEDGYKLTNGGLAIIAESSSTAGTTKIVTHVLHPTLPVTTDGASNVFEKSLLTSGAPGSNGAFTLNLSGSFAAAQDNAIGFSSFTAGNGSAIPLSIVSTDNNYVSTTLGNSPKSIQYPVYVQYENPYSSTLFGSNTNLAAVSMSIEKISTYEFIQDYQSAATPWITSQKIGSVTTDLFKIHSLSQGDSTNYELKVGIANIRTSTEVTNPDGYPRFDVVLRRVATTNIPNSIFGTNVTDSDTNASTSTVVIFQSCCLNPDAPDYIGKKIGDTYQTINDDNQIFMYGEYANTNPYVRVEVAEAVKTKSTDKTLFPFGFRSLFSPTPNVSGSVNIPATVFKSKQTLNGIFSQQVYHGFDYTVTSNLNYLAPIPTSGSTTASNVDFYLGDVLQSANYNFPTSTTAYSGSLQDALIAGTFDSNIALNTRKFMIPMQGGFDGARPNLPKFSGENITDTNTFGFDCQLETSTGTKSYNKAFTLLSNADYYDMNVLLTPGVIDRLHAPVTNAARNLCKDRQDVFYVMDSNAKSDSIQNVIDQVRPIDNNYTATYWPWLNICVAILEEHGFQITCEKNEIGTKMKIKIK